MGFLSKLFGQKQNDKSNLHTGSQKYSVAATKSPDLSLYEEVVDQITVSDALRNNLKIKLKAAFEDPKSFYDNNNEYILADRGLRYPEDVLLTPKFVLIDTLQNNGQMAEVDWKEDEREIRSALYEITMAKEYDFNFVAEDLYGNYHTSEIIQLIDERELEPAGYSLQILDINSDSYVFTIVPLNKKQEVEDMFAKLK